MFSRIILLLSLVCTVFCATAAAQVQAPGPGPEIRVALATQPCVWSPQGVASFKFGEPRVQDSTAIISFAVSIVTEYDSRAAAAGRGTGRVVRPANRAYAAFMSKTAAGWRVVSLVLVSA